MNTSTYIFWAALAAASFVGCSNDPGTTSPGEDAGSSVDATDAASTLDAANVDAAGGGVDAEVDMWVGPRPYPEPGAWPPNTGPGGPTVTFEEADLYQHCAYLDGGPKDVDHHNLVVMWDGYLLMPWASEGLIDSGISFFDVSDPCNPVEVGKGEDFEMRESHSIGFATYEIDGEVRDFAVVNQIQSIIQGGVQFWEITDVTNPTVIGKLELEDFFYPDAYRRVTLSVFWQPPYVYAAMGTAGIIVIDASDPTEPVEVGRYVPEPVAQFGQVQVIGDLLVAGTAEGSRAFLLDVSDPEVPQPIPGGDYPTADHTGEPKEAYFSNFANGYQWFARKEDGGGLMAYDIRDPSNPTLAASYNSDGNGGYIFVKDDLAFVGESRFAAIYDVSDMETVTEVARLELEGDLDTVTPIGNVAVLSVDDEAVDGQATAIAPYQLEPDSTPPRVTWSWPADGADDLTPTSRIGVSFNEMVDPGSAWEGSVRLWVKGTDPAETRVDGWISAQENIVNFTPQRPLDRDTTYVFEIPAGGIVDYNGNAVDQTFSIEVTTR